MNITTLIQNAKIVDGSGNPWWVGDVALDSGVISALTPCGQLDPANAAEVVDAGGKVVSPGFIDIQSHAIVPLMIDGRCLSKITQGVTTEIMGEGWTPAPFTETSKRPNPIGFSAFQVLADKIPGWNEKAQTWRRFSDWLNAMTDVGVSPNVGSFFGAGTLRQEIMGMAMRPPTDDELNAMRKLTAEAMEDGACGISYALIYPPDSYTTTDEVIEICKVVGQYNGVYITHMRSEADGIFEALEETFKIGRDANLPVEIYHLKASGRANWPKMPQVIEAIDAARASGLDVTADMYPYPAAGTGLTSVFPTWLAENGSLFDNLRDPEMVARLKQDVANPDGTWEAMANYNGPEGVMPIGFQKPENQQYVGKRLSEIAEMRGQTWVDATIDLLLSEQQRVSTVYHMMSEDNVRMQLQLPWIKVSTDAGGYDPAWAKDIGPVHPRSYGTYTRVLGRYVREENALTLEDAVRKMTSSVADRLGLRKRGLLREGMAADVIIFDPDTVTDNATFEDPHQLSTGVSDVWVNGQRVLAGGEHTGATPGQVVRPWQ
ncbi:MAG: D-aminoacylase [Deinococcota bacterium]